MTLLHPNSSSSSSSKQCLSRRNLQLHSSL
jgi:hypothetical protein